MGTVLSFQDAANRKASLIAEENEINRLKETFPYILIESCILVGRYIDWDLMKNTHKWDEELISKLQIYAARISAAKPKTPDYMDLYEQLTTLDSDITE